MPSFRNPVASFGPLVLSAFGLTLVVHGWIHPEHHTAAPGLSLLIIGALGVVVRAVRRAAHQAGAERRECMTTIREEQSRQYQAELFDIQRKREELVADEAQLVERVEARRTEIYAEATRDLLIQLRVGLPLKADGGVIRTLPARRASEAMVGPAGCAESGRRVLRKDYLPN